MYSFIHAADIHLDSPLRGIEVPEESVRDEIRGATRRAFDNLVELALREHVAFIVLAGDLFDGDWKDFNSGLYFAKRMARLRESGVQVFIVSGNHDAVSHVTKALSLPENVFVFSSRKTQTHRLESIQVAIHGQGYAGRAVSEDLSRNYPPPVEGFFNIGLLHTALNGREGHEPYAPCTVDGLRAKGYQYWALGHVHQREVVWEDDPWIVFPGNTQGRTIRETGAKGCTLVTVADGLAHRVEHVDLDVLRWDLCRVDVSECRGPEEILEKARGRMLNVLKFGDGRPVVARLELHGATPMHQRLQANPTHWEEALRSLAADLGGDDLCLEKIRLRTKEHLDLETLIQSNEALGGLITSLLDLEMDADALRDIDPDFEAFLNKLPAELFTGEDAFAPTQPEQWAEIRTDVKNILVAQLLQT
ncbi:DNA repair exonuclease SbcCD nuclease subunit [Desulfonatronum thiosulfatophilum]|uniref:DNA repair exonuclease SbcCD nuclease subunit n=1 Tax=Desulfonatronum thiosulfatophilum TaxID=617002 RepID=A0A1G6AX76_9BACT|nr:DNA repair exonuclease [Desulfonatronum thiosulfatophilum]SDB12889.1 DNA repair exonuclease SbcCD nuclease subunit [Desulfonatronum thiosulfatophilum]